MDKLEIVKLDADADHGRAMDLCNRASDYIKLEKGKAPDADYVTELLTEAPPVCGPDDVFAFGAQRPDGSIAGIATAIRNFYEPGEWYMGLLLLDPAERGAGLGHYMATQVIDLARADKAPLIRICVLDANPRGRKFWESLGFAHERTVPGEDTVDGHKRHVLQLKLEG